MAELLRAQIAQARASDRAMRESKKPHSAVPKAKRRRESAQAKLKGLEAEAGQGTPSKLLVGYPRSTKAAELRQQLDSGKKACHTRVRR